MPHTPDPATIREVHYEGEGRIRPLPPTFSDYFRVFGLPPRLCLDVEALRGEFLGLSREFHPDFHATAAEETRQEVLRRSALVNNAWKTLRELPRRVEYLVATYGKGIESDKSAVPAELLEEMFDIQEAGEELREARLSGDGEALARAEAAVGPLRQSVRETRDDLLRRLGGQAMAFDQLAEESAGDLGSEACQEQMRALRQTLDRLNYLRTVLRNLK